VFSSTREHRNANLGGGKAKGQNPQPFSLKEGISIFGTQKGRGGKRHGWGPQRPFGEKAWSSSYLSAKIVEFRLNEESAHSGKRSLPECQRLEGKRGA